MIYCALSFMIAVMYKNIEKQLSVSVGSHVLSLSGLALRHKHFQPVSRALQCQTSLRELHLDGETCSSLNSNI